MNADSVTPGCFCEAGARLPTAHFRIRFEHYNVGGSISESNLHNERTTNGTGTTATSVVNVGALQVTQAYAPPPPLRAVEEEQLAVWGYLVRCPTSGAA